MERKNNKDDIDLITIEEERISFEKLRDRLKSETPAELKTFLRSLLAEICLNLENFAFPRHTWPHQNNWMKKGVG